MTRKIVLLAILTFSAACGSDQSPKCQGHKLLGTWTSGAGDTLSFNESCQGSESYCEQTFHFADSISQPETRVDLFIKSGNGAIGGCATSGTRSCDYSIAADTLNIDCGTGVIVYTK